MAAADRRDGCSHADADRHGRAWREHPVAGRSCPSDGTRTAPSPTPTAAADGSAATTGGADPAWASSIVAAATGREVDLLPWGDADVAALVHDGDTPLLNDAAERSASTAAELGLSGTDSLLLPGDPLPDLATAARAAQAGQSLVVGPGELPHPAVLTYTPSDVASVATAQGDTTVLVPDERLSSALTTGWVLGRVRRRDP